MSKRTYRATSVNDVSVETLVSKLKPGARVIVGVDVAKVENKAAVVQDGELIRLVGWKAPKESRKLVELIAGLARVATVEVALESTGTYGDPLRALLAAEKVTVFRVSTKHAHDSAELYDGVPSTHDSKAALLLTWLHSLGRSKPWPIKSDAERDLASAASRYELHNDQLMGCLGRLEGVVARHFPELTEHVELRSASTLELLIRFGSPAEIALNQVAAAELMQGIGGALLKPEKVEAVIAAATRSTGMSMTEVERHTMMLLATEAKRQRGLKAAAMKSLELLAEQNEAAKRLAPVLGLGTAAVMLAEAGDPATYGSAAAYVKALGLNLKEKSSGQQQGQLKLTKRGSAKARRWLYLATQRLIRREALFKAWYDRKVARDGGKAKNKAIVALMRKLAGALFHVARGATFDASKLFDAARLGVKT